MKKGFAAFCICMMTAMSTAVRSAQPENGPDLRSRHIAEIASRTEGGGAEQLRAALAAGLDGGMTVSEIRDVLIHACVYCGFPRGLRALRIFAGLLDERRARGIQDAAGRDASSVAGGYVADVPAELSGEAADAPAAGYAVFAPAAGQLLREHLPEGLFGCDVLTRAERELVAAAVIAASGGEVEPMPREHGDICRNPGFPRERILPAAGTASRSAAGSGADKAPLVIAAQGSFAAGGTVRRHPGRYDNRSFAGWGDPVETGQSYHADHALADYQIPADAQPLPLVFVHGYGESARCWQTTPDGREGFQTLMLRHGYGTFLVDLPGRGRAGRTTAETHVKPLADEAMWFDIWRLGEYPRFNPGVQFPTDSASLDQFFRQMTPDLSDHSVGTAAASLDALFDRIGAGILVTHSAGGYPGWLVAAGNPNVRAVVSYEPGNCIFPEHEVPEPMPSLTGTLQGVGVPMEEFLKLTKIPIVLYFGDYIPEEAGGGLGGDNWRVRLQMGRRFVEAVNRHGGNASLVELPKAGIYGNTHFLMSDRNNGQLADLLHAWLCEQGLAGRNANR